MALDLEEQEQVAELKAWWKQYGNLVVALCSRSRSPSPAGRPGTGTSASQAAKASALYDTLAKAAQANDAKALRDAAGTLVESYPRTLYASMGALVAARYYFDRNDLKSAKAQLQWVIDRAASDDFRDLARLRLAAVLLDEKAYDEALKLLEAPHGAAYDAQYAALKGDVLLGQEPGRGSASAAYKLALEKADKKDGAFQRQRAHAPGSARRLSMRARASPRWRSLALAGCGSPQRPEAGRAAAARPAQEVRVLWSAQRRRARERFAFSPALVGDAIFAAARDGTRGAPGRGERRRALARFARAAPFRRRRRRCALRVVVATEEGEVIALDARDGKLRWRARVSSEVLARAGDRRRAGAGAQRRQPDLRVRRGRRQAPLGLPARAGLAASCARPPASPSPATPPLRASPAASSWRSRWPTARCAGRPRWRCRKAPPSSSASPTWSATRSCRGARCAPPPTRAGSAASRPRTAARSGRATCRRSPASALDARYAFVSDDRGAVHALDRSNGRSVWKQDKLAHRQLSLPLPAGEPIAVGDLEGYVHFLARDSGAFVARYATGGGAVRAAPRRLPQGLLVQTQDGGLLRALRREAGHRPGRAAERRQVHPL